MPNRILKIYEILREGGIKFNPFDLESSLVGHWVLIAKDEGSMMSGYRRGDRGFMERALNKLSLHRTEIDAENLTKEILESAYSYYDIFMKDGVSK